MTQRVKRKIIKTIYNSPQSNTRGLDPRFATEHVSLPPKYWDDVIFSDQTKIMLYYHDGPQSFAQASDSSLKYYSYSKVWKTFVMVWGCISSKGVDITTILDEIITKEVYLDILKNELIASIKKFGFIDPVNPKKSRTGTPILDL